MIDFGMYAVICIIVVMILMEMDFFGWATTIAIIATIVAIVNIPLKEINVKTQVTKIHSTGGSYNNITGHFFLGTGYIKSEEMYTGNTFDGTYYNRIYIPVKDTQRREVGYLTNTALYKQPLCRNKPTLFKQNHVFQCTRQRATLEIPKGTIIQQLNFQ
jgi:hypothetical protein